MFDLIRQFLARRRRDLHYSGGVVSPEATERAEMVALIRERPDGLSWHQLASAVLEFGSVRAARAHLVAEDLFGDGEYDHLVEQAGRDIERWASEGLGLLAITDDRFPARVRDIYQAPPFLMYRGRLLDDDTAVSVVGSRASSERGVAMAGAISQALVQRKISVVSGLAAGVDAAAHHAALACGGRTIAVIGTGINRHYPAANRALQEQISEDGLVLSQFWPDAPPQKQNFPMRNAVMSGYGIATVVVEAGEHSGARIQARMAVEHGRPVILTDLVVNSTTWGAQLADRPDVHVATSLDDVLALIDEIAARPTRLGELLDLIAQ